MAEFAMWGPEQSGSRLADADNAKLLQSGLTALKTAGEIEDQPVDRELKRAHGRHYEAQARKLETEAARDQAIMARLTGGQGAGKQRPPEEMLNEVATFAMEAGDFEKGQKLYNAASQIRGRRAAESMNNAREGLYAARTQQAIALQLGSLFGGAKDQDTYQRALVEGEARGMDISGLPTRWEEGGKEWASTLSEAGLTQYQRLRLKADEIRAGVTSEASEERRVMNATRRKALESRMRVDDARIAAIERNDGKGSSVATPKRDEVLEAKTLINDQGLNMLDKEAMSLAARGIASRAREKMKGNKALGYSQALRQALDEAVAAGDFEDVQKYPSLGPLSPKGKKYKGKVEEEGGKPGASAERSIPASAIPRTKDGKVDESKLQKGWYDIPGKGKYRWDGSKWQVSSLSSRDHIAALALEDDDDDDEDLA
jgi:hypothetical protein